MTTALKTFLGIPLVTEKVTCKFCNASIDDFDKHALKCRDKGALMQRHNIIKKCVSDLCVAGGLYVDNEPSIFGVLRRVIMTTMTTRRETKGASTS